MLNSIILSIGDELTHGHTVDTNSAWLSKQLSAIGIHVSGHITVGDERAAITAAIQHCASSVDLLVISGGLGPTEDDLTREALADAMNVDLVKDPVALETLRNFFDRVKRPMPPRNEVQTFVPRGASAIPNSCGTAPGIAAQLGGCRIVVMPGVPKEMFAMWEISILPELKKLSGGATILSRTLHTFGMGESRVAELLQQGGDLMNRSRNPAVGTTVSQGIVSIRIYSKAENETLAYTQLEETIQAVKIACGSIVYGSEADTLASIVAGMLKGSGTTVTTAESCTGGLLAKLLTDIPGSSAYFNQGFITYSNEAKQKLLDVPPEMLGTHGAVSEPVATAMAQGALRASGADHALAITGIAGPDGGTETKPVGTVVISLATRGNTLTRTFNFPGDREMIRDRSAKMALSFLRYHLLAEPLPF